MATKAVTIALAAVGGVVLLGSGTAAAVAGVGTIAPKSEVSAIDVSGVQKLDAEIDGAELRIEFYDGDEAQLQAEHGSTNGWTLRTDGDELKVRTPQHGWFGLGWLTPDWFGEGDRVILQLPESLAGLDTDLTLNAGMISADGEFDSVDLDINAGRLQLAGAASSLELSLNAGRADVELDGVEEAELEISAGRADAEFTGSTPREVSANVSAGQLNLTLPEDSYDVRQEVSAGNLNNGLRQDPDSANLVRITVSAGTANLREG